MDPDAPSTSPAAPQVELCVRQDYGYAAGCVWVLAVSAEDARRRGESVLRTLFPTSLTGARRSSNGKEALAS